MNPANPAVYLKAIVAAVAAGLGLLYVALNDGVVSPQEWVQVAEGMLVAGASVYQIPNLPVMPVARAAAKPSGDPAASDPAAPPAA